MKKPLIIIISFSIILLIGYLYSAPQFSSDKKMDNVKTQIRKSFPNVTHISTEEFKNLTNLSANNKIVLLDVREAEEYDISHIKNAKLSTDINDALIILKSAPKDTTIVAYCSVGYRSSVLVRELTERGFMNVVNMEGSIFEWANKGYPVYNQGKKVHDVHPYDASWGKLLNRSYHPNP